MSALIVTENDGTVSYTIGGTPSSGPFTADFIYFLASEVVVKKSVAGVITTLVTGTDYSLVGTSADDGFSSGSVTLVVPASSCIIIIERVLSTEKSVNFPINGALNIRSLNTMLSRLFSWAQDLRRTSGDPIRFPAGEESFEALLPSAAARASKFLAFDSYGNIIAVAGTPSAGSLISAAMTGFVGSASLAVARTTLDVYTKAETDAAIATAIAAFSASIAAGDALSTVTAAPVGTIGFFFVKTVPTGWVLSNGTSIGKTGSGATGIAGDSAYALFVSMWANFSNSERIIQTSAGAASTRGASALNDWNALKRMPLFDLRDEFVRGADEARGIFPGYVPGTWLTHSLLDHSHNQHSLTIYELGGNNVMAGVDLKFVTDARATNTLGTGSTETRPRSFFALACVKL